LNYFFQSFANSLHFFRQKFQLYLCGNTCL
jgi:hypothetical protein